MSDQYKDNFWGQSGFDVLEKRVNEGTESTRLFLYFMKERASIEESYAKSLQKLLKNTSDLNEYGTLRDAWFAVRGEVESLVRVHNELSTKIDKDIVSPFEKFKSEQKKVKKSFLHDGYKLNKERKDLENNINKYKTKYDDYSKQAETMAIQMETAKNTKTAQEIGKIQVKLQKLQKEAHLFEQDYKDAVNKLSGYQPTWEEKVSSNYHTLQMTEEERIDYIKVQLEKYVGAINSTVPDTETTNRNLVKVVALVDKYEDIQCFVRESRTGTEPPPPPSFIPFGGKASSDYIQSKSSYSLASSTSSQPPLTSSYSSNSLTSSKSQPPPPQRNFSSQKKVVALYDYVGSDATELDFFAGDIITVIEEDESGWNVGQLGDRQALYPSNYCKEQ
ncbi:hypothetical protein DICPUDRAFT_48387 [Dictyostelium purpureum]|uniref:SH3 domain-containing protein n=1 Tax=Dictyostelium purpureum TaxID=5786 RepID=F0ZNY9_DICPU|nr:uncharacterized protein DICPUDRAFT_48387 [Dictyostelium purpureum]EGC34333.1 hypothetical protein DICPUDRAFT_48387 [Dictyostelium purpureum]|eukprot:XP_003289126.1 hypothetical protein DICPUDRAFT_48387 [Dictyostelium purpureum]